MTASLEGRFALVTGASSGIGHATAIALAAAGARVLATGRNAEALDLLSRQQGGIEILAGDLTKADFVARLCARAAGADLLVNNAGALKHAGILDGDPCDWERVFRVNVLALLAVTQPIAWSMVARRSGHIVMVSSLLARRVAPFTAVYAASKHAVAALSQGLRMEVAPHGVRVTEVAPGLVRTGILRDVDAPAVIDAYAAKTFSWLTPEQIADTIVHAVLSPASANIDLIEIRPDGQF
jgi:NADP-dependent 3-hydroxy acid dehydrogenase YdfG